MFTKVTLRQKPISKGRKSLYLDFYPPITVAGSDKPTRREFLNIYIFENPKNRNERYYNKETLEMCEKVRMDRETSLNKSKISNESKTENNGWIKIESEADLPKVKGLYHLVTRKTGLITIQYRSLSFNKSTLERFSHYQPIEKPEPPIY